VYFIIFKIHTGKQCLKTSSPSLSFMSTVAQPKLQENRKPKTGILMMNMGGPSTTDKVGEYLHRIMTDRDMIQLPLQRFAIRSTFQIALFIKYNMNFNQ
jgi:hypothetical protein